MTFFLLDKACEHWSALMNALGDPEGSDLIFLDLAVRYDESHRAYHMLTHIVSMLDELELVREHVVDWVAVSLAIWYHDVVYDTQIKDQAKIAGNEEESANLAERHIARLGLDSSMAEHVRGLIMATTHADLPTEGDARYVADLDLVILGKTEQEFGAFEAGIRAEYSFLRPSTFAVGRAEVLQSFLNRTSIYATPYFRKKYEDAARRNLERAIAKLWK